MNTYSIKIYECVYVYLDDELHTISKDNYVHIYI